MPHDIYKAIGHGLRSKAMSFAGQLADAVRERIKGTHPELKIEPVVVDQTRDFGPWGKLKYPFVKVVTPTHWGLKHKDIVTVKIDPTTLDKVPVNVKVQLEIHDHDLIRELSDLRTGSLMQEYKRALDGELRRKPADAKREAVA